MTGDSFEAQFGVYDLGDWKRGFWVFHFLVFLGFFFMGSPDEPMNGKAIDASVGGLVWVRRRNGSWWPGRIVGLDELSESCLVSPRAGTPVKLLGREDASM